MKNIKLVLLSFTLIELLIVIAIIAILAGMMLPGIAKVKALGQMTSCRNNMRQFALLTNNYADDNNSYVLPSLNGTNSWITNMTPYIKEAYKINTTSLIYSNVKLYRCPGDPGAFKFNGVLDNSEFSYGWNAKLTGTKICKREQYRSPSTKILYGETMHRDEGNPAYSNGIAPSNDATVWRECFPYPRHAGQGNILWADLHVSTLPRADLNKISQQNKIPVYWTPMSTY